EPPRRIVLAWRINAAWQFDPAFETEVEVVFTAVGPKQTHVSLEHRGLAAYGEALAQVRGMLDPGWAFQLNRFQQTAGEV
ncbi:MAG: hypothetical protein RL385_1215, partial [Pseudomonadota bacterium]